MEPDEHCIIKQIKPKWLMSLENDIAAVSRISPENRQTKREHFYFKGRPDQLRG